jgi:hypothetical protein
MKRLPVASRVSVLSELTDSVVTTYYESREVDPPPYAYVIHDRETKDKAQQLHTHVVLPGTAPTFFGEAAFYNRKRDVSLFNAVVTREFEQILDRELGREWRKNRQHPLDLPIESATPKLPADQLFDLLFPR